MQSEIILDNQRIRPVIEGTGPSGDGLQYVYRFDNGYGASIISHSGSYGVEMAVVEWDHAFDDHDDYTLCYTTTVAGDVMGWLTFEEVIAKLGAIKNLPFKAGSSKDVFGILN